MGTKRGRFLMRQPRIKRESDSSQPSDTDLPTLHYLNVPHLGRVERQHSDPLPAHSPPPGNLLSVPGGLVKQHSHPLLPSQIPPVSVCFVGGVVHWRADCTFQPLSPPLHIQLVKPERAVSPVVVVSDSIVGYGDAAEVAPTQIVRVRNEELKRSASSPQVTVLSSYYFKS